MTFFPLWLYIFSLVVGLGTIFIALELYKKYQIGFLAIYLFYLAAFTISGFINLIGRFLAFSILSSSSPNSQMTINLMFGFMIFPFMLTALYFFISLMWELCEKKLSRLIKRVYLLLSALLILLLIVLTKNYLDTQELSLTTKIMSAINFGVLCAYIAFSLLCFLMALRIRDDRQRGLAKTISACYFVAFFISLIFPWEYVYQKWPTIRPLPMVLLYFCTNLPPLLILRDNLRKYFAEASTQLGGQAGLAPFFSRYSLSQREQEVIQLMIQGKSNKDIESELFISLHTVKNHIYNIYQKLGVKNRLQVVSLIRESMTKAERD